MLALTAIIAGIVSCRASHAEITAERALQIANDLNRAHGFDEDFPPSQTTVKAHDTPDNECIQLDDPYNQATPESLADFERWRGQVIAQLKGRRYFTVRYVPGPETVFGQPVCVVIDRDSGAWIPWPDSAASD